MPRPFYDVQPEAYLFNRKADTPEEKVRQWVLFELLSTYGFHINNIKIEQKAKIGSTYKRADIVVYKEQMPYIVIECKKEDDLEEKEGLAQAKSYAEYFKTEFLVYTNGHTWIVKRKIDNEWVYFPDIEKRSDENAPLEMGQALSMLDYLRPILFWLHKSVPEEESQKFFFHLQNLFVNFPFEINKNLQHGAIALCRFIVNDSFSKAINKQFINLAIRGYDDYFHQANDNHTRIVQIEELKQTYDFLYATEYNFHRFIKNTASFNHEEIKFIRITLLIMRYIIDDLRDTTIAPVSQGLIDEIQSFLAPICRAKLGVNLPDRIGGKNLHNLCVGYWDKDIEKTIKKDIDWWEKLYK